MRVRKQPPRRERCFSKPPLVVPGPAFDPGWHLLDLKRNLDTLADAADKYDWLQDYFKMLTDNRHLTEAAKGALKSLLLLMEARAIDEQPFEDASLPLKMLEEAKSIARPIILLIGIASICSAIAFATTMIWMKMTRRT